MKLLSVVVSLALTTVPMFGQGANYAFAVRPSMSTSDLAASHFWTRPIIALVALDGAAKAADTFATRENIDGGGEEFNPLARPFVHNAAVQAVSMAAIFGAEIASAYLLHKKHHDHMAQAVLGAGATMNGLGAASSFKNRVPNW